MTRHQPEAASHQRCCSGIVVAVLLITGIGVLGCGKPQPAGAAAAQPPPAPPPPRTAPAVVERPAPIEPVPVPVVVATPPEAEEPEPALVAEAAPEALALDETADHLALALAAADAGDCRLALQHIRRVRANDPDDLPLRLREAMFHNDCRQPRQALALLVGLDARTRGSEPVTAEIARAFFDINQPGKAAMAWELRYIIDPSAWNAAAQASIAWLEAGVHGPAHWWYERAREAAPDSPEVRMLTTIIQSARGTDR